LDIPALQPTRAGAAECQRSTEENMKAHSFIVGLVGVIGRSGSAFGAQGPSTCTFPGANQGCPDPRGRFVIEWREPIGGGRHELWLSAVSGKQRRKLLEFDRSVDPLWSPDGQSLAIPDRLGSSDSVPRVLNGMMLTRAVNMEDRFLADIGRLPEIFNNSHRYFEAVDWIGRDVLSFRVRVYDSDPNKEYLGTFRYERAGRVSREPVNRLRPNNQMELACTTILCEHVAAARGSFDGMGRRWGQFA
jgi:hypothetical protein